VSRVCAACGYPAGDSAGVLCVWCWETTIAASVAGYADNVAGVPDAEVVLLSAAFIWRSYQERSGR
jgi:hypothetical protein